LKFNFKIALICFVPYIPLIALYLLVHIYISNVVGALLVAVGIFSVLEFFIHYRYGKTFFKKHPELDLHNFESTIMSNFVVFVGIIGIVGLTLAAIPWGSPATFLASFGLYYAIVNGFKSYRRPTNDI
jgi:small-conductance mechanosensitive channel